MRRGATDEHVVELEYARAHDGREPERPPREAARQERLGELPRKTLVDGEAAEPLGRAFVLLVQMAFVRVELLGCEHALFGAERHPSREQSVPPLRAERVELGSVGV